jgi:hypothetical protein
MFFSNAQEEIKYAELLQPNEDVQLFILLVKSSNVTIKMPYAYFLSKKEIVNFLKEIKNDTKKIRIIKKRKD